MIYSDILNQLPIELKQLYRKYENIKQKGINAYWSAFFNRICLKENLWPKYTNIYICSHLLNNLNYY